MRHQSRLVLTAAFLLGIAGCATDGMEDEGVVEEPGVEGPDATIEPDRPAGDDQSLL